MSQDITIDTLFGDICLSVKGVAKYNKNRTLEQNITLDWEYVAKHSHLLLNQLENGIKIGEQNAEEERSDGHDSLCEAEQETAQESHEAQVQEEGDGILPTVLQNVEKQMIEIPNIQHAGSEG